MNKTKLKTLLKLLLSSPPALAVLVVLWFVLAAALGARDAFCEVWADLPKAWRNDRERARRLWKEFRR